MAQFIKGQSGNPSGRPKKDTAGLKPLLDKHGKRVLKKVVDAAIAGDLTACKLILDRVYPPIKPQALPVNIPIGQTLAETGGNVVNATMAGHIPPDIGAALITALSNQAKLIENQELVERIEALESKK